MLNKINLSHLQACNQNWSEMTPAERGRICGKCKKTIIDFREMTDQEVAHVHVFEDRQVCGVYRPDQLTIDPEQIHPAETNSWRLVLQKARSIAVGITGLLSTINVNSQTEAANIPIEQTEIIPVNTSESSQEKNSTAAKAAQDSISISGIVSNSEGGLIQYGTVVLQGTEIGTITDMDGFYSLDITDHILENGMATLEFRYFGYMDTLVHLNLDQLSTPVARIVDVAFPDSKIETTVHVTQFYAHVEPEKKSLWQKFKNLFKIKNKKDK